MNTAEEFAEFAAKYTAPGYAGAVEAVKSVMERMDGRVAQWYDKYIPLFILLVSKGSAKDLDHLTTLVEADAFDRFYADLCTVRTAMLDKKVVARLPSKDVSHLRRLLDNTNKLKKRK